MGAAFADSSDFAPPPLVEAQELELPPEPPPAPSKKAAPASPSAQGPAFTFGNGQAPPPGPEVGLMLTQTVYGMLTAAGSGLLGWYLLVKPMASQPGMDPAVGHLLFVLTFTSVPVAVAQRQVSLANGSRHYFSETWPGYLSALGAQAAVLGAFYLMGGLAHPAGERVLLLGTVVGVPLTSMAAINLTKKPRGSARGQRSGALLGFDSEGGLTVGMPLPRLAAGPVGQGGGLQLQLPVAQGSF